MEGQALIGIGDAYAPWLPRRGKEFYEQALAVVRTLNDPQEETRVLIKLGLYEPVLAIAREIGDRRMEGYILVKLGRSQPLWRPRRARTFYKQALAIARETGDRNVERYAIKYLGAMYWALDVAQRARGLAAKVWRRFGRPFVQRAQQLTAQIRAKLR